LRITLVYPSFGTGRRSLYFPFGLAYIAASLRDAGHRITVVDMEGSDLTVEEAVTAVIASEPELIGFGGMFTRFRIFR